MSSKQLLSRRNFIKSGSILSIGSVLASDPSVKFLANALGMSVNKFVTESFTCELFRPNDLLHIKFFFINARYIENKNRIKKDTDRPLFMYCQIPPQHIGEQLTLEFKGRKDAQDLEGANQVKRIKSFLSGHSWLAFKLLDARDEGFILNQANLLNWQENFELITLDHFAKEHKENYNENGVQKVKTTRKDYELADLITQDHKFKLQNDALFDNKAINQSNWPLTTFEVPYKLFLSPIAHPNQKNERIFGEHIFKKDNKIISLLPDHFQEKNKNIQVYKPWSNELIFKTLDNTELTPRFKAVHFECQDANDPVELLPAPIHRFDLRGLTMMPEPTRDVQSEMFLISSTGASTSLHYKNDDPTKDYSVVAWDQKIIEGRDNYVSITFRAIDVFTGIKLNVSIIAERTYAEGVSYLPKLYYVSFAEKEKNYQTPLTVSKVPFVKIIPKTTGAYFKINEIGGAGTPLLGYVVAKSKITVGDNIACNELIPFDYVGIDKDGKEHNFKSKIIFIPAETYTFLTKSYKYKLNGKLIKDYNVPNTPISIEHIGLLNPSKLKDAKNLNINCDKLPDEEDYTYEMKKTFSVKENVNKLLTNIRNHTTHKTNIKCYEQSVLGEVTYANLDSLKNSKGLIRPDSKAANFETDQLFLFSTTGKDFVEGQDNFLKAFPLIPKMEHANVVISQINQIEGRNVYRKVEFAEDYIGYDGEIHENPANKVKLLLKLVEQPENFFSNNYRSAGAMVNPGIDIKYVSVLDQGIAYNRSHNNLPQQAAGATQKNKFPSVSIFQNQDAKILGIPLIKIIKDVLPVEDLPVFTFLKDGQETIDKIQNLVADFQAEFTAYKKIYDDSIASIEKHTKELKKYDNISSFLDISQLRSWLEDYIQSLAAKDLYAAQMKVLSKAKDPYEDYFKDVLKPIKDKTDALLNTPEVDAATNEILKGKATYDSLKKVYVKLETLKLNKDDVTLYFKESVKIYAVKLIQDATLKQTIDLQQAILLSNKLSTEAEDKFLAYHNALRDGLQEAAQFAFKRVSVIATTVEKTFEQKKAALTEEIKSLLAKIGLNNLLDYFILYTQLLKTYDSYKQIVTQLKSIYYQQLWESEMELKNFPAARIKSLEIMLIEELKKEAASINLPPNTPSDLKTAFNNLKYKYANTPAVNGFIAYSDEIEDALNDAVKAYDQTIRLADAKYGEVVTAILNAKTALKESEEKVKNYIHDIVADIEKKIKQEEQKLLNSEKGKEAYTLAKETIELYQRMLKKLKEISRQSLDYKYKTREFKSASLGVIEFIPNSNTELDVKVKYQIEFDISSFDKVPSIKKQTFVTDSSLTDFKVGLMQFIYIDFERVKFITGSDVKDDFVVKIRDVQFAGMLSFVQAFQEYLKTINNNLVFDINSTGVSVGYGFAIPDIPAGYFNFFNLSITGLLTLPFDPKKSLQFKFGIGSELNKFGLTVCGIFGGQGYFNIIAETGRGIIGMEMVLEFGAIYNLNLSYIANGTAYLVGGIYIRKYYDNFTLKGYILCVGRFNIIGLFSANLSFYLGLEYENGVMKGVCRVTASKRFSRFFEISVSVKMEKVISGAQKQKDKNSNKLNAQIKNTAIAVEDTNLLTNFYIKEEPYVVLNVPKEGFENITSELVSKNNNKSFNKSIKSSSFKETVTDNVVHINIDKNAIKTVGDYLLVVKNNGVPIYEADFNVVTPDVQALGALTNNKTTVDTYNYYESYF